MKHTQTKQVIEVMKALGGYATLGKLCSKLDFSGWKTKTPEASVRRIVQDSSSFFRIKPGLWALKELEKTIKTDLNILSEEKLNEFSHSYYQGLVVEIGNLKQMTTFVPKQDRNKLYIDIPLNEIISI